MPASVMVKNRGVAVFDPAIELGRRKREVRRARPSLLMSSGWFRLLLAVALTGVIWGLVFSVVSG